ncbi:MAG: hypothetical protein KGZ70_10790 [Hydrogenophaga sp.]|nr:hypothetical protein [Hydrogenophaga sp.]
MFFKKKASSSDAPPSAPKKSHFYLMGLSGEGLNTPIHIHYNSFESAFEIAQNTVLHPGNAFDFMGAFLVTILSPNFGPRGHTCRVSGINHKLSRRGVVDGVIAHVEMVRDFDDGPLQRVHVALREDGSVVGMKENSSGYDETDLNEVYFSYGDTVFLDGSGVPFDEMNKPQPTPRQRAFMREEKDKQISNLLDR